MKRIFYICFSILIVSQYSCEKCEEIVTEPCGNEFGQNSEHCGWTVATCYGQPEQPVGVVYDTGFNENAPIADDWGKTLNAIHPNNWTSDKIGQVFGITIDNKENIYLASSDVYYYDGGSGIINSSNINRPFGCGQIFKSSPPLFEAIPFCDLENSCGAGNGIGNIKYDKWNDQFFASNLEDGKIYRIKKDGTILDSYDPFGIDNREQGIAPKSELIWGLAIVKESEGVKVYFAQISKERRNLYSITLDNSTFPLDQNAEKIEFTNLPGIENKITDISISSNGEVMILSERGGPHSSAVFTLNKEGGNWIASNSEIYVGGFTGLNSAGGVDFYFTSQNENKSFVCDENLWASGNYMMSRGTGNSTNQTIYGIQGISINGNLLLDTTTNISSFDTDLYIDLDGVYGTFTKGGIGDVEVFDCSECGDPCNLNDLIK